MEMTTFEQRILTAAEGMKICNRADKIIGSVIYLGKNAPAEAWEEITQEEADVLQAQWDAEAEAEVQANES